MIATFCEREDILRAKQLIKVDQATKEVREVNLGRGKKNKLDPSQQEAA